MLRSIWYRIRQHVSPLLASWRQRKPPESIAVQWIRAIHLLHDSSRSDNRTHSVPDRIVSVSQPFVRPIVRGKAGKPVEFGAKLDISVVDGWTRLECCSFDTYNEAGNLREMAERFRAREGHYSPILTASALRWKKTRYLSDASQIFIRELKSFCDGLNRWY